MNLTPLRSLVLAATALSAGMASATIIGGTDVGWTLDFSKVTSAQKRAFGWFDDELKTKDHRKFSVAHSMPGTSEWPFAGKTIGVHGTQGPALFSIIELLNGTTLEDVKKTHYKAMSASKGATETGCLKLEIGAQSCEALLHNWTPPKGFYGVFYEWKVGDRAFALVVRNAQSVPDRSKPEEAAKVLISLIKVGATVPQANTPTVPSLAPQSEAPRPQSACQRSDYQA
jgi:hypothetical protein